MQTYHNFTSGLIYSMWEQGKSTIVIYINRRHIDEYSLGFALKFRKHRNTNVTL
jgi:hypothetical protein